MRFEIIFLVILSGLTPTLGQSIGCVYLATNATNYRCALMLNNPNGFDNFTSIGGTHVEGKTNADVTMITRHNGTSRIFPAIICETFPNILEIHVVGAQFHILTERSFAACKIIIKIDLNDNRITTPPVNLLVNNPLLEWFRIFTNNITDPLPVGIFDQTPNITFLCHERNPTGFLHHNIFRGLSRMDDLHIDRMRLTELPECLLRPMVDFRYLRGFNNQIKVLHQHSFPPKKNNLQIFNFQNNEIEAIDRRIFDETALLATVDLRNNVCINLIFTSFNRNRTHFMELLEPCFAEYDRRFPSTLRADGSTCNFIDHPTFGYSCELINFNASNPIITDHLECLDNSDVTGVIFTSSKIVKIPSQIFSTFSNLKFIQAVDVGLETTSIDDCGENLKFIDVSHNSIKKLPSNSFAECQNLEEIIIDNNCISSVEPCGGGFIENFRNLKKLSMKSATCVNAEFDLGVQERREVKKRMKHCFAAWYLLRDFLKAVK